MALIKGKTPKTMFLSKTPHSIPIALGAQKILYL